jgi:hypothetical protein
MFPPIPHLAAALPWDEFRQRALPIVDGQRSAVLAVCQETWPLCFQMAVAPAPDLSAIFFATAEGSSKLEALRQARLCCLFFSTASNQEEDPQRAVTLACYGVAGPLGGGALEAARVQLCRRHPRLETFFSDPATVVLAMDMMAAVLTERFQQVVAAWRQEP